MKHTVQLFLMTFAVIILTSCKETASIDSVVLETPVESTLLVKTDVTRYHQVPAVFRPKNSAELSFQLSGTIDRDLVEIGQVVETGAILMGLYNPNIDPALDSNFARLESLVAQIDQVKRDVLNLQELRKNNSASKNALEQKETDLKDLQAQQKLVQSQIDLALANQTESMIKAPFDGVVVNSFKQKGEFVQAGQVVLTLFQQDEIEVEINLTQSLWKNLTRGDKIKGTYMDDSVSFEVVELAQSADRNSHLMKVILKLNEEINNIIGQQVILSFPQKYQNVYQLPLETIVDDGINKPYIFTVVEDIAVKSHINPLFIEGADIIFTTPKELVGLVVLKGQAKLSSGMKVKVM
ncbi:MAG: efflux RND transporter periplasmic adaptor subunit [Marinicellaceae bacterium]